MSDITRASNCGCYPNQDDTKDTICEFNSVCCGNGLVKQQYTIKETAIGDYKTIYQAVGTPPVDATITVKNLSQNEGIFVRVNGIDILVPANGEIIIPVSLLANVAIRTVDAADRARVIICFELLFCRVCG